MMAAIGKDVRDTAIPIKLDSPGSAGNVEIGYGAGKSRSSRVIDTLPYMS